MNDELREGLDAVRRRLRVLTVAVVLLALAVVLCAACLFGFLSNYFSSDATLVGGGLGGAALAGFGFGWFAGRRA